MCYVRSIFCSQFAIFLFSITMNYVEVDSCLLAYLSNVFTVLQFLPLDIRSKLHLDRSVSMV